MQGLNSPGRLLVIAPHADDEVLGAGGLLAKCSSLGWKTAVCFTTISGYESAGGVASSTEEREAEAKEALEVLGVKDFFLQFRGAEHHLRLDALPQSVLIAFLEDVLKLFAPTAVVLPTRIHYNQDHRAVADACAAALRPAPSGGLPLVPLVLAYGHSAPHWGEHGSPRPSVFVDISAVIELKLEALSRYRSQVRPHPHARSLEMVRAWAASTGAQAGVPYAESFECLRHVL